MILASKWLEKKVKGRSACAVNEVIARVGCSAQKISILFRTSHTHCFESSPPETRSQGTSVDHCTDLTRSVWNLRSLTEFSLTSWTLTILSKLPAARICSNCGCHLMQRTRWVVACRLDYTCIDMLSKIIIWPLNRPQASILGLIGFQETHLLAQFAAS